MSRNCKWIILSFLILSLGIRPIGDDHGQRRKPLATSLTEPARQCLKPRYVDVASTEKCGYVDTPMQQEDSRKTFATDRPAAAGIAVSSCREPTLIPAKPTRQCLKPRYGDVPSTTVKKCWQVDTPEDSRKLGAHFATGETLPPSDSD